MIRVRALPCRERAFRHPPPPPVDTPAKPQDRLPKLLDLGAKQCIPCRMMAPILEELKKEYAGRFEVEFIDVSLRENARFASRYGIRFIPTQIFFDASGKELWRHVGFLGKDDILGKWKELGYDFASAEPPKVEPSEPAKEDEREKE